MAKGFQFDQLAGANDFLSSEECRGQANKNSTLTPVFDPGFRYFKANLNLRVSVKTRCHSSEKLRVRAPTRNSPCPGIPVSNNQTPRRITTAVSCRITALETTRFDKKVSINNKKLLKSACSLLLCIQRMNFRGEKMDIQAHERTAQIKRVSRWLFMILSAFKTLMHLGWLAIAWVAVFVDEGALTIGGHELLIEEMSLWLKLFILCLFAAGLILTIRITTHFRDLMKHFMQGDVFSLQAIGHVRAALNNGILWFVLALAQECFFWFLASANASTFDVSLGAEILLAVIFFSLIYTLLWTLEIGCDLNEESEMTI